MRFRNAQQVHARIIWSESLAGGTGDCRFAVSGKIFFFFAEGV